MIAFISIAPFGALAGLLAGIYLVLRYRGGYRGLAGRWARRAHSRRNFCRRRARALDLRPHRRCSRQERPSPGSEIRDQAAAERLASGEARGRRGQPRDPTRTPCRLPTEARIEDGRPIIAGEVDLYFRTASRTIVLSIQGEPDRLFALTLPSNPPASADSGPGYVADQPGQGLRKVGAGDVYDIRYRVHRIARLTPPKHGRKFN